MPTNSLIKNQQTRQQIYHKNVSLLVCGKLEDFSKIKTTKISQTIEVAWGRGQQDVVENIFRYTISAAKGMPTNSEFIAMIADKLRLELKSAS